MTKKQAKEIIRELDPGVEKGSDCWNAYLTLLGSAFLGPNIKKISKWSGLPRETIALFSKRLRESGIWKGSKVYASWEDEEDGAISFLLDVAVACGYLVRK